MKLLLTSAGITNKSIAKAVLELAGKPAKKIHFVFIPTAANVEEDDKSWLIDDLWNVKKQGYKTVDIVDISALPKETWLPRLQKADVLLFGGGNTFHLAYWMKKSGLAEVLPELLETRVYVGISAGSMVLSKIPLSPKEKNLYYEDGVQQKENEGLGLINFQVRPHLNSPHFPHARADVLEKLAKETKEKIYALDDQSAVKVVDGKIEIVSEGKYIVFNN